MSKQDKIRVKLEKIFGRPDLVDRALRYLDSQGCVLKVGDVNAIIICGETFGDTVEFKHIALIEPLVEEK